MSARLARRRFKNVSTPEAGADGEEDVRRDRYLRDLHALDRSESRVREDPESTDPDHVHRQTAVRELSRLADLIIVVGAQNSSNSNRLREIAEEAGLPSYLVADGNEIKAEWVRDAEVVGVTAGASAPEVLVEDVIQALMRIAPAEVSVLEGPKESVSFRLPAELAPRVG